MEFIIGIITGVGFLAVFVGSAILICRLLDRLRGDTPRYTITRPKRMARCDVLAWIFLSIPQKPVTLARILANADFINRAIPTLAELQMGLGWLRDSGLVCKDGALYSLTDSGMELHSRVWDSKKQIREMWKIAAAELKTMIRSHARTARENISQAEFDAVIQDYEAEFRNLVNQVRGSFKQRLGELKHE